MSPIYSDRIFDFFSLAVMSLIAIIFAVLIVEILARTTQGASPISEARQTWGNVVGAGLVAAGLAFSAIQITDERQARLTEEFNFASDIFWKQDTHEVKLGGLFLTRLAEKSKSIRDLVKIQFDARWSRAIYHFYKSHDEALKLGGKVTSDGAKLAETHNDLCKVDKSLAKKPDEVLASGRENSEWIGNALAVYETFDLKLRDLMCDQSK